MKRAALDSAAPAAKKAAVAVPGVPVSVCELHLEPANTAPFGPSTAEQVRSFFGTEPTPLASLRGPAESWGLAGVYLKDEGQRLGQQSFKVFGSAFAMAEWLAKRLQMNLKDVGSLGALKELYEKRFGAGTTTFVTCTDGNHGRSVAWAAKQLGQRAVVYMPKGSAAERVRHIEGHGAECTVTDLNYDATVDLAFQKAKENDWIILQDTTAPGYTEIPTWIMQGYTAWVDEALEQMKGAGAAYPTHVLLPVGVGSLAGAIVGYLVERARSRSDSPTPTVMIIEPKNAACVFESAKLGDGRMASVGGSLDSMIAGLCCGVPSTIGWPILSEHVSGGYFWMDDKLAGNGMRMLQREGIEAGECGGTGVGLMQRLMDPACPRAADLRQRLKLGKDSTVLLVNTEAATDMANYKVQMGLCDASAALDDFDFAPSLSRRS